MTMIKSCVISGLMFASVAGTAASAMQTAPVYQRHSEKLVQDATAIMHTDGKAAESKDLLEKALVANPANVNAIIALGQVNELMKNQSEALRYYRLALVVDNKNLQALSLQAQIFLQQELISEADLNLIKMKSLCATECDMVVQLEENIDAAREGLSDKVNTEEQ